MNSEFDYRKHAILYVDDEQQSLKMFADAFGRRFRVLTAPNAAEAWTILQQRHAELGLVITDQRMPGERGVQFLERARAAHPHILRLLTTAYSDIEAAISAVNSGAIYKYIPKPWNPRELEQVLAGGLQFFQIRQERDQLLRERAEHLHRLMIADRILSLGILSAGLSHHIRNSLVAVRTFLDLAPAKLEEERGRREALQDPDYWRDFYGQVQGQIGRITQLLTDLGAASDQTPCHFTPGVRLAEVLTAAIAGAQPQLESHGLTARLDCDPALPPIPADAARLRRLFDLLLADEISTLPAGGHIHIRLVPAPAEKSATPEIQVTWQDDGPGLTAEALRAVFDPFFQRADNPQETGINLMACHFIVHQHGGRIEVQNQAPGLRFDIFLPLDPAARTLAEPEASFIRREQANQQAWEKMLAGKP